MFKHILILSIVVLAASAGNIYLRKSGWTQSDLKYKINQQYRTIHLFLDLCNNNLKFPPRTTC